VIGGGWFLFRRKSEGATQADTSNREASEGREDL
jgi:hypothetical protein